MDVAGTQIVASWPFDWISAIGYLKFGQALGADGIQSTAIYFDTDVTFGLVGTTLFIRIEDIVQTVYHQNTGIAHCFTGITRSRKYLGSQLGIQDFILKS